ncbi:ACT domain-containing protein [uncultured Tateyamaria sp.]|uniref:ACT domain-containing protein n=1 Tax=uncultured Tateyamaria sp. TaxID=455651 RepID=UPI0026260489|nr:ACT domain-containing protein [uncultured Tateyamaria sp.]
MRFGQSANIPYFLCGDDTVCLEAKLRVFKNDAIKDLWKKSRLIVWPDLYCMVSFDPKDRASALNLVAKAAPFDHYFSIICDQHEVAVILPDTIWNDWDASVICRNSHGPFACLTFDIPLDVEVAGYLQPAVNCLADAGISIVPQCALIYDHVLVNERDLDAAICALTELRQKALSDEI